MARRVELRVRVSPGKDELMRAAAEMFAKCVGAAVKARGVARVALSGGSTPKGMFELLAGEYAERIPWAQVQVFWVDERCVGPDDPDSNYGMTKQALLDKVPLPAGNVHRMEGELDPEEAASRYEAAIRTAFRLEGAQTPTFDFIQLGLGPDGHTASLFPHTEGLDELARICIPNHVPQKDTWRMTLTWPVIAAGREVMFLVEGSEKAGILRTVLLGAYDPETYPAQLIRPASGRLTLLVDEASAAELPKAAADGTVTVELK